MRYRERPDLALIAADSKSGCAAAGVFTRNRFCAAPVELCKERLKCSRASAVLANAGIANACTGAEGLARAKEMTHAAAEALGVPAESVLAASTGVIGMQLEVGPAAAAMPALVRALRPDGWQDAARAIMTTDTVPKMASMQIELSGRRVIVGGIAKGAGMIAPDMATLLVFVCTDAAIAPDVLGHWTRQGAERSFNRVTIDGDTSTNDTLIVLAGGAAGNPVVSDAQSPEGVIFGEALSAVLLDLARQVVLDGEGATKFIEIEVSGAPDAESAKAVALTIANSPLVKTAFFGEDANWGRIVAAAGRAGVPLDPEKATLYFDGLCVFRQGTPVPGKETEEKAARAFRQKEIRVHLDLAMGDGRFTAYTCDFSYDYIKINASYRS
jgi:glutamate N-acetyltransferase / amino-acid N-acetyltransferase